MNQSCKTAALLLTVSLFLLLSSSTSARLHPLHQGEIPLVNPKEITLQEDDDFFNMMGLEKCGDKDEDCQRRRMVAEAHLDYIYTQHQKP